MGLGFGGIKKPACGRLFLRPIKSGLVYVYRGNSPCALGKTLSSVYCLPVPANIIYRSGYGPAYGL